MGIFHIIYNHFCFSVKTEIVKQITEPALAFKADYLEELELLTLRHSAAGSREVGITIVSRGRSRREKNTKRLEGTRPQ